MGFNQREIGFDRVLQHVVATVDFPCLLTFRQRRAVAGGGKHRPQPGASRLDPRREVALRHQLQLHFAATVEIIENLGIHLAREGADHLAYSPGFQQRRETHFPVAGVVINDGQVAGALVNQGVNQKGRLAGGAKAADHNSRPIVDPGDGLAQRRYAFINHQVAPVMCGNRTVIRCSHKM